MHVRESIHFVIWEWPSFAQTVPLSQAMQAQEDREFLIYEGKHFCRLLG